MGLFAAVWEIEPALLPIKRVVEIEPDVIFFRVFLAFPGHCSFFIYFHQLIFIFGRLKGTFVFEKDWSYNLIKLLG